MGAAFGQGETNLHKWRLWTDRKFLRRGRMQERMDDIEIKYIYLQKTVDELNMVVIEQQKEIRELRHMVTLLSKKLHDVSSMQPFDPDEKPPHY
jgi:SlyX protein